MCHRSAAMAYSLPLRCPASRKVTKHAIIGKSAASNSILTWIDIVLTDALTVISSDHDPAASCCFTIVVPTPLPSPAILNGLSRDPSPPICRCLLQCQRTSASLSFSRLPPRRLHRPPNMNAISLILRPPPSAPFPPTCATIHFSAKQAPPVHLPPNL